MNEIIFKQVQNLYSEQEGFETGAVRDTEDSKGSPCLMPNDIIFSMIVGAKKIDHRICSNTDERIEALIDLASLLSRPIKEGMSKQQFETIVFEIFHHACLLTAELSSVTYSKNLYLPYTYGLRRLALHYQNGAQKYAENNWRKGMPMRRYYNSLWRHLMSILEQDKSEDHCAAVIWNIVGFYTTWNDVFYGYIPEHLNDFPFTYEEWFGTQK